MFLAFKEMRKEKGRFILIIAIVVLISYLIFFLTGLAYGLARDNRLAADEWHADRIVLQSGTNSNIMSSVLQEEDLQDFKGHKIAPINVGSSVGYINEKKDKDHTVNVLMMGLDDKSKSVPKIIEGHKPEGKDQVIASITLKKENGVKLGDTIQLSRNSKIFKIVGFTEPSKLSIQPVIYTDLETASAASMIFNPKNGNSQDQTAAQGQSGAQAQAAGGHSQQSDATTAATFNPPKRMSAILVYDDKPIKNVDNKYDILSIKDYINALPGYMAQFLTFGFMIGFLILISTIVLGVFMYIITIQKKQTFGIMKAQGISNKYIADSVVFQTLIISILGVVLGVALTYLSEAFLPATVPFTSNPVFYMIIALIIVAISLLGALFSVKGVLKVDPLEVI